MRDRIVEVLRSWPLTWRLIAVVVVLLVTSTAVTTLATTAMMRTYLVDRAREDLTVAAVPIVDRVASGINAGQSAVQGIPARYAGLLSFADGQVGTFDALDERYQPQLSYLPVTDPRATSGQTFTVPSVVGDAEWIVVAGRLDAGQGTYQVASSMAQVEATLDQMRAVSTAIGFLASVLGALIGWLGIRRAFRPLRAIEDTAAAIAEGDLTRRVDEHMAQDEIASLSRSLNSMLAQIETSFAVREASEDRMRRFVTDASHELRTPLATIRGYAELYRQGAVPNAEATAAAMSRIEGESTRMAGLVEDLLTLARLDNRRGGEITVVDLTVLASDAVADARAREPERAIRLVGIGPAGVQPTPVLGDEARLRQVAANLLANAVAHTPSGTPIEVGVGPNPQIPDTVTLLIVDHGRGIPREEARRVFERFYRGDPARGRQEVGGHGLGLAIVAAIVEAHGGRVGVAETPGGGATFIVDLPVHRQVLLDEALDDDMTDDGAGSTSYPPQT